MDSFNINILPEENSVNITQGEPVNISVSQEVVQIAKIDESVNLEFLGDVTKIDANYPEALAAAQTAIEKAAEIEQTVEQGTADFNANAVAKTNDFNANAVEKTTDFNDNAVAKTLSFDVHAADSINEAKSWAIGEPVEPAEGSAKYWAGRVGGLISRVDTIESKIPSAASSSNQLADKDWVESQEYITGITSSDVTTALGYTPYSSSNPNGYTSNVGTVTSVNNTSPDGSGNVTLSIPATQVNSDWNAVSGVAEILNKPSLATVATSGSYNDLSNQPTIPTDNNQLTNGAGYQTASDVTTSINAINALAKIPNYTLTFASSISLTTNTSYILTLGGDVAFVLPNPEAGKLNQIEVQVYMATAYTIDLGTTYYFGGSAPDMSEAGYYSIMYEYDWLQQHWIAGALKKGAAS